MRRALSYADAVRILGGGESRVLRQLDRASAVGLLAAGGFNFFEARQEIVRLGGELVAGVGARLRGVDRMARTERLLAAHTVIVVTAYFDELGGILTGLGSTATLNFTAGEEISLASRKHVDVGWRNLAAELAKAGVVKPALLGAHESTVARLESYYHQLGIDVVAFVSGLAAWDDLDHTQRDRFEQRIGGVLPAKAVAKYEELFARLAVDCAEFKIWSELNEHRATRVEVRGGLSALEGLLVRMAEGRLPDARMVALSRANQAALGKPITLGSEVPVGLQIPTLGEGYIDHRFRAAEVMPSSKPGWDSWWDGLPVRDDLHRFLAAFLTSPQALEAPLLILGQPGSGKSVLTRVLAARLPVTHFLPVRVELRQVPAEAELQDQIEAAVRAATGESMHWPRLVESANGALPVVFLDGFDELLQATGVTHTDFLLKAAAFQEREADQGRPVAVIVTSRIAVADRAALPPGAAALRLEPFDDEQVAAWLQVWHRINGTSLLERGMQALPVEIALMHRELAEQPLLLLMLALYDAHANALQRRIGHLSRTELYQQLLEEFARREVRKQSDARTGADLDRAVEAELLRLSVVAFGMFNRRSQWIAEADLNTDLTVLLRDRAENRVAHEFRTPLTPAQTVVGRFFFVHEAQATRDGRHVQTYEFLHATFGEFLVARLVVQILTDMVNREKAASSALPGSSDDGLLHALLSFAVLTARAPVVIFLRDLVARWALDEREVLQRLLLRMHRRALRARTESAYAEYEPRPLNMTVRYAAWSANLVLLVTMVAGEVTASRLFSDAGDEAAFAWRDEVMMWRSQLSSEEWSGLIDAIAMERLWVGDRREVRLWIDDGTFQPAPPDLHWTYFVPPGDPSRGDTIVWLGHTPSAMQRKSNFTSGKTDDMMTHALQPIGAAFPNLANMLVPMQSGSRISATHALLDALAAPYRADGGEGSAYANLVRVIGQVVERFPNAPDRLGFVKTALSVLLAAAEESMMPAPMLDELMTMLGQDAGINEDIQFSRLFSRLITIRQRMDQASDSRLDVTETNGSAQAR